MFHSLVFKFESIDLNYIGRDYNHHADLLSKEGAKLDEGDFRVVKTLNNLIK